MSKQSNRGKEAKDDFFFGTPKFKESLKEALIDMNYLLTRGYSEKNALFTVGTRYKLASRQQKAVQGMSASNEQLRIRKVKEVAFETLENKTVVIDGFNILILLESTLSNAYIFKGQDHCYRDLSSVHGNYKTVNQTEKAIDLVVDFYNESKLQQLVWIFDKQVSNSGRIKAKIEAKASEQNLNWRVILEDNADLALVNSNQIVASSDGIVLDKAINWFNLTSYLIETKIDSKTIF
ncbi:hypothetical protein SY27_13580 [Flavobacterium sp. 316]|uniref:DUF434 domain-containing protein n=1 Tax=Flavobacterium sp. 316 TaxID=1603293 RepID=UPI0005E9B07C|nr:DUF434 domain-containing protein [Flavobacterium sp. 316]KIX20176.1 hypothetical protein SY27_13580 [Flavobacterium sp. 316]